MPDCGPLGDTFLEAKVRATTEAFLLNKPAGGCVESVFTLATHRFFLERFFPGVLCRIDVTRDINI
jgi:hypothetical protein